MAFSGVVLRNGPRGHWVRRFLFLMLVCHPLAAVSQTFVGTPFPIAINWASVGAAFDGTNYLVAMESGSHKASVAGQLISQSGARPGSLIAVGTVGQTCCNAAAFDGTNYLMVWEDDSIGTPIGTTTGFTAKGQFINTAGTTLGQPFVLTNTDVWVDGVKFLAFGGGKYLFTYRKLIAGATGNSDYVAGRIISPDGTLGKELRLSAGQGSGGTVGFDGSNFLVAWTNGSEVRGRFVSPAGALGQEISINASPADSDIIAHVAFDGTNYLVVFHDAAGGNSWDVYGQLVSPAGALVGGVIKIANIPETQMAMGVAFDGANYLTSWTDVQAGSNWLYGRFISKSGALVGDRFAISTNTGAQFGGIAGFANGKYLALVNSGAQLGPNGLNLAGASVSGLFVGTYQPPPDPSQPIAPPPPDQTVYTAPSGQLPSAAVAVTATGTLGSATVTIKLDLSKILSGGSLAAQGQFAAGYNIYVAALAPAGALGLPSATFFQLPASGAWGPLTSPIAAYREGLAQSAADQVQITILQDVNVTSALGTEVYIGYGTSDAEMLQRGRYRGVYILR